jgi:hypothetical protein
MVEQLIATELRKQGEIMTRLTRVLIDLHDVCEGLRLELAHLRTNAERMSRLDELAAAAANGG